MSKFIAASTSDTARCATRCAPLLAAPLHIYLAGELGVGKTFWVQSLLAALGEQQRVRSPSYALVYSYQIGALTIHHFDCYRLQGAPIGDDLLELLEQEALCLLEWHEQASNLPAADLYLNFSFAASARVIQAEAASEQGEKLLCAFT